MKKPHLSNSLKIFAQGKIDDLGKVIKDRYLVKDTLTHVFKSLPEGFDEDMFKTHLDEIDNLLSPSNVLRKFAISLVTDKKYGAVNYINIDIYKKYLHHHFNCDYLDIIESSFVYTTLEFYVRVSDFSSTIYGLKSVCNIIKRDDFSTFELDFNNINSIPDLTSINPNNISSEEIDITFLSNKEEHYVAQYEKLIQYTTLVEYEELMKPITSKEIL